MQDHNGNFALGYGEDRKPEREAMIPEGTTVLKFRVYNISDILAKVNIFGRSKFKHTIHFSIGTPTWYWYNNVFMYGEPLRFPEVEPGGSDWVEIPLTHIRNRDMTEIVSDGDKLRAFNFGARSFGKYVWGTRVAYDDVAFGRSGLDHSTLPNLPPVSHAGRDQTTKDCDGDGKEIVLLNGLKSYDGNAGLITSWVWKEGDTDIASGFAPSVELGLGTHNITLTVQDEDGATSTDTVTITVLESGGTVPGDVDGDGDVDIFDLFAVASAFGTVTGDAGYNPACDFDSDGDVDINDLYTCGSNFGVGV